MLDLSRRTCAVLAAAFLVLSLPRPSSAAGFALFEQGARGMGFGGAYVAQTADPSAIFHNAAGIAFLKGKQIYVGGTLIAPKFDFDGADPFPGAGITETSAIGLILPPAAYYTQHFSEDVVVGVGFNVPFGLRTEWANPQTFSGRFVSQVAQLNAYSVNPTVAVRLADRLAVGAGVDVRISTVELRRRAPVVNPFTQRVIDAADVSLTSDTSTAVGFNLGVIAKPSEGLSFGASYRHKINHEYTGNATFQQISTGNSQLDALLGTRLPTGAVPLTTAIEFPAIACLGVAYTWGDWTIEADVNWYQWSTFDNLIIRFESRPDLNQILEQQFEDVFQYRAGLERVLNDVWTVRAGYFFDSSPSPTESVSPILPDADRQGIAAGATWRRGRLRLDLANWLVLFKDRSTEGRSRTRYEGTYKSFAETFSVSLGYSF